MWEYRPLPRRHTAHGLVLWLRVTHDDWLFTTALCIFVVLGVSTVVGDFKLGRFDFMTRDCVNCGQSWVLTPSFFSTRLCFSRASLLLWRRDRCRKDGGWLPGKLLPGKKKGYHAKWNSSIPELDTCPSRQTRLQSFQRNTAPLKAWVPSWISPGDSALDWWSVTLKVILIFQ
jgi:hypothetical protein